MIIRAVVVLPEPDSPTIASEPPGATAKLTSIHGDDPTAVTTATEDLGQLLDSDGVLSHSRLGAPRRSSATLRCQASADAGRAAPRRGGSALVRRRIRATRAAPRGSAPPRRGSATRRRSRPPPRKPRAAGRGWCVRRSVRSRRARSRGEQGPACTDAAPSRGGVGGAASSTTKPAYITAMRSQTAAASSRSWVTKIMRQAALVALLVEDRHDLGLRRHVQRSRGLVGEQQSRLRSRGRPRS